MVRRLVIMMIAVFGAMAYVGPTLAKSHHHHSGKQLLGEKINTNGEHILHKNGNHTVVAQVTNGKIAGVSVNDAKKGNVPVKKYKTKKQMANYAGFQYASYSLAQLQDLGETWIGYSYIDDFGDEQIYWFPYEMVLDGDTGAVEYIPLA